MANECHADRDSTENRLAPQTFFSLRISFASDALIAVVLVRRCFPAIEAGCGRWAVEDGKD